MNKYLILISFFLSLTALHAQTLGSGLYRCKGSNERSICDQNVMVYNNPRNNKLIKIAVEYVGECGSIGPFLYACKGTSCEDQSVSFKIFENHTYLWKNKQYGIKCEFAPVPQ